MLTVRFLDVAFARFVKITAEYDRFSHVGAVIGSMCRSTMIMEKTGGIVWCTNMSLSESEWRCEGAVDDVPVFGHDVESADVGPVGDRWAGQSACHLP
jgi:hypothetical protein